MSLAHEPPPSEEAGARLCREAWARLYAGSDPAGLQALLRQGAAQAPADAAVLHAAWQTEVMRQPHHALRGLREAGWLDAAADLPRRTRAGLALVRARAAQMFDAVAEAQVHAREALAEVEDDLDPLAVAARFVLGLAQLDAGRPQPALESLQHALRAARRDRLDYLEALCAHALGRALDDLGRADEGARLLDALASPDAGAPAPLGWVARSLRRQARARALQALQPLDPWPARPADYWSFPDEVQAVMSSLAEGEVPAAQATLTALETRAALDFHCARWRADLCQAQVWAAWARGDGAALARLAAQAPAVDAQATLAALREAVCRCAAAALLGRFDAAAARAVAAELEHRQLVALSSTLALVTCLAQPDPGSERLAHWWSSGRAQQPLDLLWLAPLSAPRLQAFLRERASVGLPAARTCCERVLQRLASAALPRAADGRGPPPEGLTRQEWRVLCGIANGFSNEQIAAGLHVSLSTVKTHVNRLYGKLGLRSRAQAVTRGRALAASLAGDTGHGRFAISHDRA
jgi:LuxR family maltose regulon positive regulatory protein